MTSLPPGLPPAGAGLPDALRRRVLDASLSRRAPGRPTPAPQPITPLTAFTRATDALGLLLADLTEAEWAAPTVRELDVQGLVGHLIGVERDVQRALGRDPGVADVDHVLATQDAADAHRGEPPARTLAAWQTSVTATRDAFAVADPSGAVAVHTLRLHVASLMVLRTFELWVHENDIQLATGRDQRVPDDSTLALMTDLAARALRVGADRSGLHQPVAVRLVLTGRGGGTWDVRLGRDDGHGGSVALVADAVGFCRLAANRLDPGDLDVAASGDLAHVGDVLTAAGALGLD